MEDPDIEAQEQKPPAIYAYSKLGLFNLLQQKRMYVNGLLEKGSWKMLTIEIELVLYDSKEVFKKQRPVLHWMFTRSILFFRQYLAFLQTELYPPQNSHIEVLTPSTSECDCI